MVENLWFRVFGLQVCQNSFLRNVLEARYPACFVKKLLGILSSLLFLTLPLGGEFFELRLWPNGAPGSENSSLVETVRVNEIEVAGKMVKSRWIQKVSDPTISVFLPEPGQRTGTAVMICPGGGFNGLEFDKEGTEIAHWLNKQGIVGIVLKYRLPDEEAGIYVYNGALPDAQRAIRIIRSRATEWGIDPQRIGVTGFSAGGYLAAAIGTFFDNGKYNTKDPVERMGCRPDFIAPIYPLVSLRVPFDNLAGEINRILGPDATEQRINEFSIDKQVTENNPPAFMVQAHDDYLPSDNSILLYSSLKQANVSVEMHIYSVGGHGFAMREGWPGEVGTSWPPLWLAWMRTSGFLN
jgi:acetyl esterase/lipase